MKISWLIYCTTLLGCCACQPSPAVNPAGDEVELKSLFQKLDVLDSTVDHLSIKLQQQSQSLDSLHQAALPWMRKMRTPLPGSPHPGASGHWHKVHYEY